MTPTRLQYGSGPHQWGEFAAPHPAPDDGPPPLVVNLHGGFWHAQYALDHARPFCAGLRQRGWATLNLEYRRVGNDTGGWPGTFDDVAAGLGLVTSLVDDGWVDGDRVVVAGHSAGGHLALWVAGGTAVRLAGVVAVAAVTDLRAAHETRLSDRGTAARDLMGSTPDEDPRAWHDASPIEQVPLPIPAVLVHGERDEHVPLAQSRDYVTAATAAGADANLEITGEDHFAVLSPASTTFTVVAGAVAGLAGP